MTEGTISQIVNEIAETVKLSTGTNVSDFELESAIAAEYGCFRNNNPELLAGVNFKQSKLIQGAVFEILRKIPEKKPETVMLCPYNNFAPCYGKQCMAYHSPYTEGEGYCIRIMKG